jgi:hypothetical protein
MFAPVSIDLYNPCRVSADLYRVSIYPYGVSVYLYGIFGERQNIFRYLLLTVDIPVRRSNRAPAGR